MKPETQLSNFSPELQSVKDSPTIERTPTSLNSEPGIENNAEHYEQKSEMNTIMSDVGLTSILPAPVNNDTTVVRSTTLGDNPLVAGDDDLIEKDWVDKAKKIVAETKDNPHKREEAVNELQVDYLKKRYGRKIGVAE